jgi:hypothetical protein
MTLICALTVLEFPPSLADDHTKIRGKASSDNFALVANQALGRTRSNSQNHHARRSVSAANTSSATYRRYTPAPTCTTFGTAHTCRSGSRCTIRRSLIIGFWGARPNDTCATTPAAAAPATAGAAPALPQVTPGMVATALRRLRLPAALAQPQPDTKTLVNFDTVFHTDASPLERTVTLLGQLVVIQATPTSYTWHYGDGASATTTSPGTPYRPGDDVGAGTDHNVHRYLTAHVTTHPSVDLTYAGRYRLPGGPWTTIPGTVTITGPTTPLRVSEATALLSGTTG